MKRMIIATAAMLMITETACSTNEQVVRKTTTIEEKTVTDPFFADQEQTYRRTTKTTKEKVEID
jgi:hypothetical protein